eukprot:CAMPEP_0115519044 /NCGR_PEP_ID=MMETSP0271-20121206/78220_1 /TAXON_ID=71861 /ORGANISM="Scrippsiella trochoidea, Strain CCMP3099" /LENGTH=45 /DNA_ID= /DNA_START= /DNA_END= /DNA_ORIENTATION=
MAAAHQTSRGSLVAAASWAAAAAGAVRALSTTAFAAPQQPQPTLP